MSDMYKSRRRQLWADLIFSTKMDEIKLKSRINGINIKNVTELTKMIIESDHFKEIENEILSGKLYRNKNKNMGLRFDGNL